MGIPKDRDAKRFYLAAGRRLEDGRLLAKYDGANRGAVYLAGYCVECMLKALIVVQVPSSKKSEVVVEFRGSGAHNFDRLRTLYYKLGGARFPKLVTEAFITVRDWVPDWRYEPGTYPADDTEAFLNAVQRIYDWADKRL
jgi:HEPN domain-containing protein